MFWMSNIGLVLSSTVLNDHNLTFSGKEAGIRLYTVNSRMGDAVQAQTSGGQPEGNRLEIADPRVSPERSPTKILDQGDLVEFEVNSEAPSTLITSRKFHRDWRAQVLVGGVWKPARTCEVNGVFQGVFLPENAERVRLVFAPWTRYAWIGHLFWLGLLAVTIVRAIRNRPGPANRSGTPRAPACESYLNDKTHIAGSGDHSGFVGGEHGSPQRLDDVVLLPFGQSDIQRKADEPFGL